MNKAKFFNQFHRAFFHWFVLFFFLKAFAKEIQIVHAIFERIFDQAFQEIFSQIHVVLKFIEGHFRLNHPEFGKVARGIGVFGPECWSESINVAQSSCPQFAFQLSRNGQVGSFSEEIL